MPTAKAARRRACARFHLRLGSSVIASSLNHGPMTLRVHSGPVVIAGACRGEVRVFNSSDHGVTCTSRGPALFGQSADKPHYVKLRSRLHQRASPPPSGADRLQIRKKSRQPSQGQRIGELILGDKRELDLFEQLLCR